MLNGPWWTPTTHCADDLYICKIPPVTRDSSVSIGCMTEEQGFDDPQGKKDSPLLSSDQTNPVHSGNQGLFPGSKAGRVQSSPLTSI